MTEPISNLDKLYWKSEVNDIPCVIRVDSFTPGRATVIGNTPEESEEGYPDDLDFTVLDDRKIKAPWLSKQLTEQIIQRLVDEFYITKLEIKHYYQTNP